MSNEMGALPATIKTATIVLHFDGLAAGATGLATVSLVGVAFNEGDAPAVFGTLELHTARDEDVRVELSSMSDTIEEWPRWTGKREFSVQVSNLSHAPLAAKTVDLLLSGFAVAVVPKAGDWTRQPPLPVPNTGSGVTATDALGAPLACLWRPLS